MIQKPPSIYRFHSDDLLVFERILGGDKLVASCPNIEMAIKLQAALNQLDDICVYANIPRPLKTYGGSAE